MARQDEAMPYLPPTAEAGLARKASRVFHRLRLASWLDRKESQIRRVGERIGWPQAWLKEFAEYRKDPRLSLEEFFYFYCQLRQTDGPKLDAVKDESEARAFYAESEYPLYRQIVHRRHSAWRRVLWTMRGTQGMLMEFGSGIAPVSAWCSKRKPEWFYVLHDFASPHRTFGMERLSPTRNLVQQDMTLLKCYGHADVITALDTLEHVPDPLTMAQEIVERLRPDGVCHWNFIETDHTGLDLASASQRRQTLDYLDSALRLVYRNGDYRVSRKVE